MTPVSRISALVSIGGCLVLAGAQPSPAATGHKFDGQWSVAATVEDGGCTGPYRYPIVVRGGTVDDAGNSGVDASGRVAGDGRIVGTIRSGLANVVVRGRLNAATGTGRWNLTGAIACAGRWTARKDG